MRWRQGLLTRGDEPCKRLWGEVSTRDTLVVTGDGFDPRVPRITAGLAAVAADRTDVLRLQLGDESAGDDVSSLAASNRRRVEESAGAMGGTVLDQGLPEVAASRSAGVQISREFHKGGYLDKYEAIIVDISGMPRPVYFPLILGLLKSAAAGWTGDVHVALCESPEVDSAVLREGAESPSALGGFAGQDDEEPWAASVWVPILGERTGEELSAILDFLGPDEIIPVLPFPSLDPRRADDLVAEHRELIFERLRLDPRNFLYASEWNPFDLYRSLIDLYDRYQTTLRPLGAAKFVLSAHSSKLLSIGALLAGYELGIQVVDVHASRYGLRSDADVEKLRASGELVNLWLAGAPYHD